MLAYHSSYFEASAWLVLGIDRFTKAKEEGHSMGIAAGTIAHARDILKNCNVKNIPASYSQNWQKKLEQATKLAADSEDKAKNVFFEKMPEFKTISMPDSKNFVKLDDSCKGPLEEVPIMNETLRHVIPPQVRKMQAELKEIL